MDKKSTKIHGRGNVFNLNYHLVWTPSRGSPVLKGLIAEDLRQIIINKSLELGIKIESLEIAPNYVNMLVSSTPKLSPYKIVKTFKTLSSNILLKKYPQIMAMRCLWSSSYFCGTVGQVSESIVNFFIKNKNE